jgi:diguanylate cyclase (GGDEF)-like protein
MTPTLPPSPGLIVLLAGLPAGSAAAAAAVGSGFDGPWFWRGFGAALLLAIAIGLLLYRTHLRVIRDLRERTRADLDRQVQRRTADLEVANRNLRDLADTDGLTGLSNRRHFDRLLREAFERALLTGRRLSVLLLDVDHFKQFNDSRGHLAGDAALKSLGQLLQKAVRSDTVVARYGGEEFAVIAPGGLREATGLGERLRRKVESELDLRISVGVACLDARADRDEPALLARADRALYAAKAAGRNRVEADSLGGNGAKADVPPAEKPRALRLR